MALPTFIQFTPGTKAKASQVNANFQEVRDILDGQLDETNLAQLQGPISWDLIGNKAIVVANSGSSSPIDISQTGILSAGSATFEAVVEGAQTLGSGGLFINLTSPSSTIPVANLQSAGGLILVAGDSATDGLEISDDSSDIHVDLINGRELLVDLEGTNVLLVNSAGMTLQGELDLASGGIQFEGGPSIEAEGADVLLLKDKVRLSSVNGPLLSYEGPNNNLLLQDSLQFSNTSDGPKLFRSAANTLEVNNVLKISNGSESATLDGSNNDLNVDRKRILAAGKPAVTSEPTANGLRIIQGIVDTLTNAIIEGIGFTVDAAFGDGTDQRVLFTEAFASTPVVVCTVEKSGNAAGDQRVAKLLAVGPGEVQIQVFRTNDAKVDGIVHFIAIGPRA
jgi:hypothetical protein